MRNIQCVHTHVRTYACTYTHMYTHTHTHTLIIHYCMYLRLHNTENSCKSNAMYNVMHVYLYVNAAWDKLRIDVYMDLLHFVNGSSRSTQATSSFQSESLVVLSKLCLLSTSICQETSWMQSIILQQEASTFAKRKLKQLTTAECTTGTYHSIFHLHP